MIEDCEYSDHLRLRLAKRIEIEERWIDNAISAPDPVVKVSKSEWHFLRVIRERGNRVLKVVVNPSLNPKIIVTAHFDRRLKGKL